MTITNYLQMDDSIRKRNELLNHEETRLLTEEEQMELAVLDEEIENFNEVLSNYEN